MGYTFGKSVLRHFYPLQENEPIVLPSQAPSIWLYSSQPSEAEAASGANRITAYDLAYWTETSPYQRTYTFSPIPDPEPTSSTKLRGYWEVVRFVTQSSQQAQSAIRYFEVERVEETDTHPGTTVETLKQLAPQVAAYFSDPVLEQYIANALEEMKLEFEGKKLEWADLYKLNKIRMALGYKALAMAFTNQIQQEGDRFSIWATAFKEAYRVALSSIAIESDSDGDGVPDAKGGVEPSFRIFAR